MRKLLTVLMLLSLSGFGDCNEDKIKEKAQEYIKARQELQEAVDDGLFNKACAIRTRVVSIRDELCELAGSNAPSTCSEPLPGPPSVCIDGEI